HRQPPRPAGAPAAAATVVTAASSARVPAAAAATTTTTGGAACQRGRDLGHDEQSQQHERAGAAEQSTITLGHSSPLLGAGRPHCADRRRRCNSQEWTVCFECRKSGYIARHVWSSP